jgi:uncharacterized protein
MVHSGLFQVNRSAEEVFDLLANPERFAPLMPDFESMTMQDATHFTLRTVIQVGPMSGHANLAMELRDAARPGTVGYSGEAIIAGSPLRLRLDFALTPGEFATEIGWRGEVTLGGPLALMVGSLVDTMGRQNFEQMAAHLQENLRQQQVPPVGPMPEGTQPDRSDFEI